ncbi:MAG: cellulase family glycosylhydrolase [Sedimentisphaerales bacterium]|nr:cellulase family glycosylhydrolase [Sedimentisphaerales bacterium]
MKRDTGVRWGTVRGGIGLRFVVALLGCLLMASWACAQERAVATYGSLRVERNRIVGMEGEPAIVRGMSLYWSQWKGQFYNPDCVKWLRDDWNCGVVRASMAVGAGGYLNDPEREKEKVKAVVQAAIDLGMYVIIDWHDHNAHQHLEQAQAFFEEMAQTYGQHPNVIYETWNEPLNTHDWSTVIKPYHEAVIPKIRARDSDNLIVCGTQTWSQDVDKAAQDPIAGDNIAYALHFYASTHKQPLRDKAKAALEKGVALMVTEWGASEASGNGTLDREETQKWIHFMNENELSWCNWSVADLAETSAALKPGASTKGGWSADVISPSGLLVRQELRKYREPDILYVPTPMVVVDKMLELAQVKEDDLLYDLGCGDGRIVVEAAKRYGCRAVGYDINPVRVQEARENVAENNVGHLVRIEHQDVFTLDLSDADVITLYLLPSLNVKLIPQLEQLKPGARIVSHDFDMRGVIPDEVVNMNGHTVYLWTTPLKKEGSN